MKAVDPDTTRFFSRTEFRRRFPAVPLRNSILKKTWRTSIPSWIWASPANTRTPAASTRICTAAGFGLCVNSPDSVRPKNTNLRFKYLLEHGQTGLSVAFDYPTLFGYDSDNPISYGEVGRCGVAIDSLADMEALFNGIRLDQVTTSMTTNAPAAIIWSMYLVTAEKQGESTGKSCRAQSRTTF